MKGLSKDTKNVSFRDCGCEKSGNETKNGTFFEHIKTLYKYFDQFLIVFFLIFEVVQNKCA